MALVIAKMVIFKKLLTAVKFLKAYLAQRKLLKMKKAGKFGGKKTSECTKKK